MFNLFILTYFAITNTLHIGNRNNVKPIYHQILKKVATLLSTCIIGLSASTAQTIDSNFGYDLTNDDYKNVMINLSSDDFWYPPFMTGKWKTNLKFLGATFTNKIPIEKLINEGNLPGINKYSVIFLPDIGTVINYEFIN